MIRNKFLALDFRQLPLSEQNSRTDVRASWSSALVDWIVYVKTTTTSRFKEYLELMCRNSHGLVVVYAQRKNIDPVFAGYCYRAKEISRDGSTLIYYEYALSGNEEEFLSFCRQYFDGSPLTNSPESTVRIGASTSSPAKRRKTPKTLDALKVWVRTRYDLVFKPFIRKHHVLPKMEYLSICETTPMGRELGWLSYDPRTKSIGELHAVEQGTLPFLLIQYLNLLWKQQPNNIPSFYRNGVMEAPRKLALPPPTTYKLVLEMTLRYEPDLAGQGHEEPHSISVYPTQGFFVGEMHTSIDTSTLKDDEESLEVDATMVFDVSKNFIPHSAMLNFDVYATYINTYNQKCINQAGYAAFKLVDLLADLSKTHETQLVVSTSEQEDNTKGHLFLQIKSCNLKPKEKAHAVSNTDLEAKQSLIMEYITENTKFYHAHPASNPSIENVTVFLFRTRTIYIPGSLFDVFALPTPREDYFINVLMMSYQRRLVLEDPIGTPPFNGPQLMAQWVGQADDKLKVYTIMDSLAFFVNYCTYQTDEIDHNKRHHTWRKDRVEKTESFDDLMPRMNGDCEDFSKQILREVMMLKYGARYFTSEILLKHVLPILHRFIFVSGLAGVSAMAISEAKRGSASLNGHECVYAVPNYIFFEALGRNTPRDYPLMNLYSKEEKYAGMKEKEIIYVLEGTGNLFPEPRSKQHRWQIIEEDINQYPESESITEIYTDMVFYDPHKEDNFYKMIITMLTPEFYYRWGHPVFEFLLVKESEGLFSKSYQRGVYFEELLNIHENNLVSILPCPEISPEILKVSLAVHENNYPPAELMKPPITQEMLEVARVLTIQRPSSSSSSSNEKSAFSFQIRFADMTNEIIQNLIELCEKTNYSLRCDIEPVHQSDLYKNRIFGGYNISFY